jgi:uncharacterized protein (TIGR02996 family)
MSTSPPDLETWIGQWQRHRDPTLGDAIDGLDQLLRRDLRPLPRTPLVTAHARWMQAASSENAVERGRAIAAFPIGRRKHALLQLAVLHRLDDPRVATRLLHHWWDPPFRSTQAVSFLSGMLDTLVELGDPRAVAVLTELEPVIASRLDFQIGERIRNRMREALETLTALPPPPPVPESALLEVADATERIQRLLAPDETAADLLRQIYANPDDDGLRQVLADRLGERGDPRGEFIMLQYASAGGTATRLQRRRERALAKEHAEAWTTPLTPTLVKGSIVFERGFLTGCTLRIKTPDHMRAVLEHPAWNTVRRIRRERHESYREANFAIEDQLVLRLTGLRHLEGYCPASLLEQLTQSPAPRPLETLHVPACQGRNDWLSDCPGLPHLHRVLLQGRSAEPAHRVTWLLESPLGRRLTWLSANALPHMAGWLDRLRSHSLPTLELRGAGKDQATLTRTGDHWHLDATFVHGLASVIETLPPRTLSTARLRWSRSQPLDELDGLLRALARAGATQIDHPRRR